ncbi:MAG: 1-acyl-sn-glycerol-3-phosphate acyltransferase [Patescibacteria group bacterium]
MEGLKKSAYLGVIKELKGEIENGGFQSVGKRVLEESKIKPVYTLEKEDPLLCDENRQKLNTEAGVVIANHPGYFDTFFILNTLKRKDVKIVVSGSNYETFGRAIGEEFLIKATRDPSEVVSFLRSIKDHIESGGLVLIYPTGGGHDNDKNPPFENGFSVILKRCLKPTDMVYSFYIDPEDFGPLVDEKISRLSGIVSAVTVHPSFNVNRLKEEAEVRVHERYSTAEEWQEVLDSSNKKEKNQKLTEHFLGSFQDKPDTEPGAEGEGFEPSVV